ncbi:MAG: amino acid permease [Thermoleophilia bacterium]|nr:amino acid permease [Thermoleophilia bacterium]
MASPASLRRALGTRDAVIIGMGSMIGAGVFTAIGPAAAAAGDWLLLGLALAGLVALCNAMSSAWLAALYPESGGTYVYGRRRLGHFWGFIAGWAFVVGKLASCAAMAFTIGVYLWPAQARALAIAAVVVLVAVNYAGIQRTAAATRVILVISLLALAVTVVALLGGDTQAPAAATGIGRAAGIPEAAAFFFFAFAGYARIATLGEEVRDPARTIPRAIPLALGLVLVVYLVVSVAALWSAGPALLAASPAPLAAAVDAGSLSALAPVVRAGAAIASVGVLLALIAGISRTGLAMSRGGDLPTWLSAVHPRFRTPYRAEVAVGAVVIAVVALGDLRGAIAFSSFAVLAYYAVANASALTLPRRHARGAMVLPALGLLGCVALAASLPWRSVAQGAVVLAAGALVFAVHAVARR